MNHARRIWNDLRGSLSTEAWTTLLLTPLFLTLHRYITKPAPFRRFFAAHRAHPLFELYSFVWWYVGASVFLCLLPLLMSRFVSGRRFRDLGGRWGDSRAAKPIAPAFVAMALAAVAISFAPSFQRKYPLLDMARERFDVFLLYESLYGLYFFAWEFFFRGWMLKGLRRDFGTSSIWIQTIPFALLHFGKPLPEAVGAIPAGLFLGWVAYRADSFLYGWALHWGVAFAMDAAIVARLWL